MNKSILILGTAREESSRLEDKMTRKFDKTSLYRIYLNKLEKIYNSLSYPTAISINKNDKRLWEATKNTSIEIIERNDKSVCCKSCKSKSAKGVKFKKRIKRGIKEMVR